MKQTTLVPVVRTCPLCSSTTKIYVTEETDRAFFMYQHYQQGYIQDIPVDQFEEYRPKAIVREFLKTGYCLECQSLMFGGEEEDYEKVKAYH